MQTLGKYRVSSGKLPDGLEDVHEGLWHGCLQLVGHCREVVLEVSKEPLAFKEESLHIGLRICGKAVQVRLLHGLIAVTGAQKHIV